MSRHAIATTTPSCTTRNWDSQAALAGLQPRAARPPSLIAGQYDGIAPVRRQIQNDFGTHGDVLTVVEWLRSAPAAPRSVFVTHGEPGPADAMRQRIEQELGWTARVPLLGQSVELTV